MLINVKTSTLANISAKVLNKLVELANHDKYAAFLASVFAHSLATTDEEVRLLRRFRELEQAEKEMVIVTIGIMADQAKERG